VQSSIRVWPSVMLQGKMRKDLEANSREIVLAAAAAEKGREQAGSLLQQPPPPAPAQKRPRLDAASAAGPVAAPKSQEEADALMAKIISGELWPKYG